MQTFTTLYIDQDDDVTAWNVAGDSPEVVLRDFLVDMCPESAHQLERLSSCDELRAWASERECIAEVVPH